jgi:hypothetical protein
MTAVAAIQKIHNHFVPHFRANHGPKNSQPDRLRLRISKGAVCVFDEAGLRPLQLKPRLPDGCSREQIVTAGGVVPADIFGGDVVVPSRRQAGGKREEDEPQDKRPLDFHGSHYPTRGIVLVRGSFWNDPQAVEAIGSTAYGCVLPDIRACTAAALVVNVAVTEVLAVIVIEHVAVPLQPAPLHPAKVYPPFAVAVSVTSVP